MSSPAGSPTLSFDIHGFTVTVDLHTPELLDDLAELYKPFRSDAHDHPQLRLTVQPKQNPQCKIHVTQHGQPDDVVETTEYALLAALEGRINDCCLTGLGHHWLMHSAAVTHEGGTILMPGSTGSGKSTLAAGLVQRGFRYLTDELVVWDLVSGRVLPYAKAISIKADAAERFADLSPRFRLHSGVNLIWYLDPSRLREGDVYAEPSPVKNVFFPKFDRKCNVEVQPLTPGETIMDVFRLTCNSKTHKAAGLDFIIEHLHNAGGYRIRYGDLWAACQTVIDIVQGNNES